MKNANEQALAHNIELEQVSEDPFAAAMRASRTSMIITDPRQEDNPIVFANEAFLRLTGYTLEEVIGRNCRFLQGHGTDKGQVDRLRDAITARQDITVELLNYRKDGTPFQSELHISPIRKKTGELQFFFASQSDATERISAEASRRREAELRLIVEGATDYAIITIDTSRRVTSWSPGAERALGWSAAEMVGQMADTFFTPEDCADGVPQLEIHTASTQGVADDKRWHQRKDGGRVYLNGKVRPLLRDEQGVDQGFIKIARDETARKTAEDDLHRSEEFNSRVLAASTDCIKVLDLDGRIEFMSEGGMCVMEVDGFSTIQGANWPDFWPGDGHDKALAAVAMAKQGGTGRFQGPAPTMKGSPRRWDVIVSAMNGADGKPEKLLSGSRDVTAVIHAQERLRDSEERLRLATDAADVGFWDVDMLNDKLIWPVQVKIMFGVSPDATVTMQDFYDGLHCEDRDVTVAAFNAATDPTRRALYDVEYRTIGKEDGVIRWVAAKGRGLFDDIGRCVRVVGTAIDITERKKVDLRLQELNSALEEQVTARTGERNLLWELSRDIMLLCSFDGRILLVNPAWTELLGWRETELVNQSLFDLVHPDDLQRTMQGAAAHSDGTSYARFENRYRHRDGSYRAISWSTRPTDKLITAVGRDVTAEKEAEAALAKTEEALRQSQKMEAVGQLTGGLAHDFNNLLAGISGALELINKRVAQGRLREIDKYVVSAQSATKRAAALTQRLLAFSRRQTLLPKNVSVNALIGDMLELIERTVGPSIKVENVAAAGLWTALVDPSQLENALLNLCINARDAMPGGGRLTIETCNRWIDGRMGKHLNIAEGQYLSMCVSDDGVGMPPEVIQRAFDPFFTTKPIGEGTGLGLSMIYGFAKQSGGQVRIHSEVGKGTTVCVYLPRSPDDALPSDPAPEKHADAKADHGETVLVVDDEPTIRMLIAEILGDLGYTALEAGDSAAGLRMLHSGTRIDLLISDVGLPGGMNGRQMADAARVRRPGLKVMFITGFAEAALFSGRQLEPGMAVMTKPFELDVFAARIRELLESD